VLPGISQSVSNNTVDMKSTCSFAESIFMYSTSYLYEKLRCYLQTMRCLRWRSWACLHAAYGNADWPPDCSPRS